MKTGTLEQLLLPPVSQIAGEARVAVMRGRLLREARLANRAQTKRNGNAPDQGDFEFAAKIIKSIPARLEAHEVSASDGCRPHAPVQIMTIGYHERDIQYTGPYLPLARALLYRHMRRALRLVYKWCKDARLSPKAMMVDDDAGTEIWLYIDTHLLLK